MSVLQSLRWWVGRSPDACAIVFEKEKLTYKELDRLSSFWATALQRRGVKPGDRVAAFFSHSLEVPIAFLAIWKVGAIYVPIDPIYPIERVKEILQQAQVVLTLIHPTLELSLSKNCMQLSINQQIPEEVVSEQEGEDAYLIFTSGTTGKPKGVLISQANLWNVLTFFAKHLALTPCDKWLSITPTAFDIFALELFLPLICGATCVLTPRSVVMDPWLLIEKLKKEKITLFQAMPSTYQALIEEEWPSLTLRHLLCGGEAWSSSLAQRIALKKPLQTCLWNVYGPTETTIWSSITAVQKDKEPVLSPTVTETYFYVVDSEGKRSDEGELWIGGAGVSRGYWGQESLTSDSFVLNPFGDLQASRLYRTGDWVRKNEEGSLIFLGRRDQQVKIRGFRVELGDIERSILADPLVKQAAVFWEKWEGESVLFACLQVNKEGFQERALRFFLTSILPAYMIPQYFLLVEDFPLSPHLKTDRKELLARVSAARSVDQCPNGAPG
jgi:polyketide synthase PksJ